MARRRFQEFFGSDYKRDSFMAMLLGTFIERSGEAWCSTTGCRYKHLGRPTIRERGTKNKSTVDYLWEDASGKQYVGEAKCWISYDNYRRFPLTLAKLQAFERLKGNNPLKFFLRYTRDPTAFDVDYTRFEGDKPQRCSPCGSIIVWSSLAPGAKSELMNHYGLADVLSFEELLDGIHPQASAQWTSHLGTLRGWATDLFDFIEKG